MSRLTEAQRRLLATIPDEWTAIPDGGDTRPQRPLLRAGMIETRSTDVTPPDWDSPIRVVRPEWRITSTGLEALRPNREGK